MPFSVDKILSAGLFTIDGEKVLDLTNSACDIECGVDGCEENVPFVSFTPLEFSANITMSGRSKRNIAKTLVYGWKARGPLRSRLLWRLLKKYYPCDLDKVGVN